MERLLCNAVLVGDMGVVRHALLELDDEGVLTNIAPTDDMNYEPYNTRYVPGLVTSEPDAEISLPDAENILAAENIEFLLRHCVPLTIGTQPKLYFWC